MSKGPILETPRLLLRPFEPSDAPRTRALAGELAIAANTLDMPHPYKEGMAEEWIATHQKSYEKGNLIIFAIALKDSGELIGAISLSLDNLNSTGELGFWIGIPYWNMGYCTEAAAEVVRFGFEVRGLNKVFARHFSRNVASRRVLEKIGMKFEGCLRQQIRKWDHFEDTCHYGILRDEYTGKKPA
jgi:ribosomal-protein-alanine N-acetyltransferase